MKYAAHTLMTVAALSLSTFSFAMKAPTETAPTAASSGEAPATQTCPSKEVTQAYLYYYDTVAQDTDVGQRYEAIINEVNALKKTGNFEGFNLVDQSMNINPSNYSKNKTDLTVNITLEFETDYKAYTDVYKKLETQTITLSVRQVNNCY